MTSQTSTGIPHRPKPVVVATGLLTAATSGAPLEPEKSLPVKSRVVLQLGQLLSDQKGRVQAVHSWMDSHQPAPLPETLPPAQQPVGTDVSLPAGTTTLDNVMSITAMKTTVQGIPTPLPDTLPNTVQPTLDYIPPVVLWLLSRLRFIRTIWAFRKFR